MTRNRLIPTCIVFAAVTWPAFAVSESYSISTEQVAASVDKIGVRIAPNQVTLLADVVAQSPEPVLQVRSLERFDANRFMVRLECENEGDCLPFVASIQVDDSVASQLTAASSRLPLLKGSFTGSRSQARVDPIVVRGGSRTTLRLDGEHIHIRIPVICLQSGSAGQTIHATDMNHKEIYAAQVVDGGLLQGRLSR